MKHMKFKNTHIRFVPAVRIDVKTHGVSVVGKNGRKTHFNCLKKVAVKHTKYRLLEGIDLKTYDNSGGFKIRRKNTRCSSCWKEYTYKHTMVQLLLGRDVKHTQCFRC